MSRDRVETDGDMSHVYFLFSDTSARCYMTATQDFEIITLCPDENKKIILLALMKKHGHLVQQVMFTMLMVMLTICMILQICSRWNKHESRTRSQQNIKFVRS